VSVGYACVRVVMCILCNEMCILCNEVCNADTASEGSETPTPPRGGVTDSDREEVRGSGGFAAGDLSV
jgi:hypothetical protein